MKTIPINNVIDELCKEAENFRNAPGDPNDINYAVSVALYAVARAFEKGLGINEQKTIDRDIHG